MDESSIRLQMQKVLNLVVSDISGIRTGRAVPALIEGLVVVVYGGTQRFKINELASITAPDPQSLVVSPWDKSIIGEIRKGILEANIGMNPSIDGEILRISFPPLTTEDREKYIKLLSGKLESGKMMIRQVRSEGMKSIKEKFAKKELTEDQKFDEEKKMQAITDEFTGKIDVLGELKKKDLLQI
jgi:ribosome recycling factor